MMKRILMMIVVVMVVMQRMILIVMMVLVVDVVTHGNLYLIKRKWIYFSDTDTPDTLCRSPKWRQSVLREDPFHSPSSLFKKLLSRNRNNVFYRDIFSNMVAVTKQKYSLPQERNAFAQQGGNIFFVLPIYWSLHTHLLQMSGNVFPTASHFET